MSPPPPTCTVCGRITTSTVDPSVWLDGRVDALQASPLKHKRRYRRGYRRRANLYNCLYTTGLCIHKLYTRATGVAPQRGPGGVAQGAWPQPHRGFGAVVLARSKTFTLNVLYRQVLF